MAAAMKLWISHAQTYSDSAMIVALTGPDLINSASLNKGAAFPESERDAFHLHGLLPSHVGTILCRHTGGNRYDCGWLVKKAKSLIPKSITPSASRVVCGGLLPAIM